MRTEKPFLLVQLSDLHLGASWTTAADPLRGLRAVVEAIRSLSDQPGGIVVSGDLVEHGSAAEYAVVMEELAALELPVFAVPGNHDDRVELASQFGLHVADGAPIDYVADAGPLRLVMLDSTVPGEDHGDLCPERLAWLEATLLAEPGRATLVVMHHAPVQTGAPAWDRIGLPEEARSGLERIIGRHPQVRGTLSGHLHRAIVGCLGGRPALTIPSTYVQARLDLTANQIRLAEESPAAFAIHIFRGGDLLSHVELVP